MPFIFPIDDWAEKTAFISPALRMTDAVLSSMVFALLLWAVANKEENAAMSIIRVFLFMILTFVLN